MSHIHLYVAMAIPSVIALLGVLATLFGFLMQAKRFDDIMSRLDRQERHMIRRDSKLDLLERKLSRFYALYAKQDEAIDISRKA